MDITVKQKAMADLMLRVEVLEDLAKRLHSQITFPLYEVLTLNDLARLVVPPPAMAYVHETANYYYMYPWSADLIDTPYNSVIGKGWHNIDSPTPRYDRMIHVIHTQWLNGWNLDYFPDYIDSTQGGNDYEYLSSLFGLHYGPPSKHAVISNLPEIVTVDGSVTKGSSRVYLRGLQHTPNTLCTFTVSSTTYSIVGWDTNNASPEWIQISPPVDGNIDADTIGTVEWPAVLPRYTGVLANGADAGTTTLQISGLAGEIDTSYQLIINNGRYKIIDYEFPTSITIDPPLRSTLNVNTPWAMVKAQGEYNTTIDNMRPGDLIYRSQYWVGTVKNDHSKGSTEINIQGINGEISDRWHSAHAIYHDDTSIRNASQVGCELLLGDQTYQIVDHEPSARSEAGYMYDQLGSGDPHDFNVLLWLPTGKPTNKLFLRSGLSADIPDGTEFIIRNKHWYVVSVEHLGSNAQVTSFETPRFPEGHTRKCFDFFHVASGNVPARFEMMLHVIASEEAFGLLFDQGRVIPGDLLYHQRWHNWYQVVPRYSNGKLNEDEVGYADLSRTITVHDRDEFDEYLQHFDFNNLWVVNNTHGSQSVRRQLATGLDANGNITYTPWTRFRQHPAEFIYYPGASEESSR